MPTDSDVSEEFKNIQLPAVAVDIILFTIKDNDLKVALIKRDEDPYNGSHALPGRFVRYTEKIEDTAKKCLVLKAGINPDKVYLEQLYTFGQNLKRDTRIRTITIIYLGIITEKALSVENTKLNWHSCRNLPELAFDHRQIIEYAVERLKNKIIWCDYAFCFLAEEFTLTELQQVYEIILDKELDKRNFRKKILEQGLLSKTQKKKCDGIHRPAAIYTFKKSEKFRF